jgi:hypothetical protein
MTSKEESIKLIKENPSLFIQGRDCAGYVEESSECGLGLLVGYRRIYVGTYVDMQCNVGNVFSKNDYAFVTHGYIIWEENWEDVLTEVKRVIKAVDDKKGDYEI